MAWINPSFQRLPEKRKWLWRVVLFLLMALNCWEWFRHMTAGSLVAAAVDAIFVANALCFIVASFFDCCKIAVSLVDTS
jgi:hypothetical protein